MQLRVIVNPAAAGGRVYKEWNSIKEEFALQNISINWSFTEGRGEATAITTEALEDGFECVVAVGGDGTINEVVNGFFREGELINPAAAMGIISCGRGKDLARTLALPRDVPSSVRRLKEGEKKRIDLCLVSCHNLSLEPIERYFINVCDLGLGAAVIHHVNSSSLPLGGFATYFYGVFKALYSYNNSGIVRVVVDDRLCFEDSLYAVFVANGRYIGGGMKIAPQAVLNDGLLDVIIIRDLHKLKLLYNFPRVYRGTHLNLPQVEYYQGERVEVQVERDLLIEMDGELPGKGSAAFEIIPKEMPVLV